MNEKSINRLKNIHRLSTKKCIAFLKYLGLYYWAYNGMDKSNGTKPSIFYVVQVILGNNNKSNLINCTVSSTFFIKPWLSFLFDIKKRLKREDHIYRLLDVQHTAKLPFRLNHRCILNYSPNITLPNRAWSCCERKIIGALKSKQISYANNPIFVDKRPCLFCLPAVNTIVYLNENNEICTLQSNGRVVKSK